MKVVTGMILLRPSSQITSATITNPVMKVNKDLPFHESWYRGKLWSIGVCSGGAQATLIKVLSSFKSYVCTRTIPIGMCYELSVPTCVKGQLQHKNTVLDLMLEPKGYGSQPTYHFIVNSTIFYCRSNVIKMPFLMEGVIYTLGQNSVWNRMNFSEGI